MAVIKAVNSRAGIGHAVNYITQKEKTEKRLIGGYNCNPQAALDEMKDTKRAWGKTGGREYKHFIQSFPQSENISLDEANRIADELIRRCPLFRGYEVVYATHKDRAHVHTHLIVNSVSFETGKKFRYSKRELQEMKDLSDEILLEHGKTICEKNQSITSNRMGAYRSIEKAVQGDYKSWLYDTMVAVDKAMKTATSRKEFMDMMGGMGYMVGWQDNRKYITFINADGKKVRDKTLSQTFKISVTKEDLLYEFSKNATHRWDIGIEAGGGRADQCRSDYAGKRSKGAARRHRTPCRRPPRRYRRKAHSRNAQPDAHRLQEILLMARKHPST